MTDLQGRTLAISGVGGFIGLRLAERLAGLGARLRGLDVAPQAADRARARGIDTRVGDITDPAASTWLCKDAEIVMHTAAVVREGGAIAAFRSVNVHGTQTLARAAVQAGARRLVHLSSVMVYGFDFPPWVDENGPLRGESNPYCQTKIEGEQAVRRFHDAGEIEVVVLRPGDVYGAGSPPWVVRPLQLMQRRLFYLPSDVAGVINHVHVDNLVDAMILGLEQDVAGETFNVTDGRETSCEDYFSRLAQIIGKSHVPHLHSKLLWALLRSIERGHELLGREPPAHADAVDFLTRPHAYSIRRARERLGFRPRIDLDQGMEQLAAWARSPQGRSQLNPGKD